MAPEHPFPQAWNDCWDALKWAAANAKTLGADPAVGFIVGGASAGGNLSAAMTQLARDEKLDPPLTRQYPNFPALCHFDVVQEKYRPEMISGAEKVDDPVLGNMLRSAKALEAALRLDVSSPLFSLLIHPKGLDGLLQPTFKWEGWFHCETLAWCMKECYRRNMAFQRDWIYVKVLAIRFGPTGRRWTC